MEDKDLILEFLKTPLDSGDEIFGRFAALQGAIVGQGEKPLERYVYVGGTRSDRVLLVAHADTVWDKAYGKFEYSGHEVAFEDGVFTGAKAGCGIGADDRAGCAMLWKLKDSGHSILVLDGEEYGKHGAKYLKSSNPKLFKELNKHSFIIELDHMGTDHSSFRQIHNTKKFESFFQNATGFLDRKQKGGCDLQILCKSVCGVNVGVGYVKQHTENERLYLEKWQNTYQRLNEFLAKPQKRYIIPIRIRLEFFAKKCVYRCLKFLKIKK